VNAIYITIAAAVGLVGGWWVRGALDRAMDKLATRILSAAIGEHKVAEAMAAHFTKFKSQ